MSTHKVSIIDVAKEAGVSYQTVSRVINNSPSVRESTRRKVQEAIQALNYHPSLSAQSLKTQRTRMVGVIASQTQYSGPLLTISAIERMARSRNLFVSVATVDEARLNPEDFANIEESFVKLGVEAVVIVAPTEAMVTLAVESHVNIPRVIITAAEGMQELSSRQFDAQRVKFVTTNQDEASRHIVHTLSERGVDRVIYLRGPQQWRDAYTRCEACKRACIDAGLDIQILDMNDWLSANSYEKISALLTSQGVQSMKNTAVWGANDLLAMGARRALIEAGLVIPDDVCVVGYDDMPGMESLVPPLTTVNPNYEHVGSLAMRLVLDLLGYGAADEDADSASLDTMLVEGSENLYFIEPTVVLRESTR
ncbi:LacI family DNA-binding transcriptional regulator [Alloscardovia omnicolens]|uniref:LacI family DNA-binding transcriptional regulator n=1 Tax=Alloscardovia omnicolens TaxID=419015 RepID=UPI003A75D06C